MREIENFVASLDTKFRDLALRVTKNDDSTAERIHALVSDMEDAINQGRQEVLKRLEERVSQLNGVVQEVVAVSDEHSDQLQQQIKESNQSSRQICTTLGHRVEELESWRNTLRQSFDFQGGRTHDSAVYSSLDGFSASSNLASSRGASGDRLHLRSLVSKDQREDDQSRFVRICVACRSYNCSIQAHQFQTDKQQIVAEHSVFHGSHAIGQKLRLTRKRSLYAEA